MLERHYRRVLMWSSFPPQHSTSVAQVRCSKSHEVHPQSGRVINCLPLSQSCGVPVSQLTTDPSHQLTLHQLYWETQSVAGHGLEPH